MDHRLPRKESRVTEHSTNVFANVIWVTPNLVQDKLPAENANRHSLGGALADVLLCNHNGKRHSDNEPDWEEPIVLSDLELSVLVEAQTRVQLSPRELSTCAQTCTKHHETTCHRTGNL